MQNWDKTSTREPAFESTFQSAPAPTPETSKETKVAKAKTKRKAISLKLSEEFLNQTKNE